MAFFDFLDDIQESVNQAVRAARKAKPGEPTVEFPKSGELKTEPGFKTFGKPFLSESPTVEIPSEMRVSGEAKPPKDTDQLAFAKRRASAKDFALKRAEKAVDALGQIVGVGPGPGQIDPDIIKAQLLREQPDNYARFIERLLPGEGMMMSGRFQSDPRVVLKDVEQAVRAYRNVNKEAPEGTLPQAPATIGVAAPAVEVPNIQQKLVQLDGIEQQLRAELSDAVTDRESKEIQAKLSGLAFQKNTLRSRLPKPPPDESLDLPGTPPKPPYSIGGAAKAAGVPEEDFNDGIEEIAKKLGLNLDEEVQFPLALQRLLNSPEFAEVRPDFEALGASGQGIGAGAQVAQGVGGEGKKEAAPAPVDLHAEERSLLSQIAAKKDINTWYEAIAFVLLSMLIKPQMAILFFSKASERGQLKADLVENRRKQKIRGEEKKAAKERNEWTRRQAIEAMIRQQERGQESKQKFVRDWFLLHQRATLFKKLPKDDIAAQMQKDFDNWSGMAAKAGQSMQYDRAEIYMDRADDILKRMEEYQAQKQGATAP